MKASLKGNGQKKAQTAMRNGIAFIRRSILSDVPANTFVLVDTHSDTNTGGLQWSGGATGPKHVLASEVLQKFCGGDFLSAMKAAANKARGMKRPLQQTGWCDDSPSSRGGWRGLLLSTCSPAMRVPDSFRDIRGLVERQVRSFPVEQLRRANGELPSDTFDFVLGFAGSSTIPSQIRNALSQVIERIGVDKTGSLWETIVRVIGHDLLLLQVNAVVVVYRERDTNEVEARKIGRHDPPLRPWGVEFHACGTPGCDRMSRDFVVRSDIFDVRMTCRYCRWTSAWVKQPHWKDHVFRLDSTLPNVFWHDYPPSKSLQQLFVDVTGKKAADKARAEATEHVSDGDHNAVACSR